MAALFPMSRFWRSTSVTSCRVQNRAAVLSSSRQSLCLPTGRVRELNMLSESGSVAEWCRPTAPSFSMTLTFEITQQWDGSPTGHDDIMVTLSKSDKGDSITMEVNAPFFNDPGNPGGEPGQPFDKLWEYEVVEAFFLGENDKYLEVELCPHGQHIVLMLNGVRNMVKTKLPLEFQATIDNSSKTWRGVAGIPLDYLPPKTTHFNAYAIHGSDKNRRYEALFPAPPGEHENPDFHRLQYFKKVDYNVLLSDDEYQSKLWSEFQ